MINVIIADDHQIVLDGIKSLLVREKDICCVDEVLNGIELLKSLESKQVDVAIVDIDMPDMNGIETTKEIKRLHPDVKVLILSMHSGSEYISQLLEIGASGYILKNKGKEELVKAIRKIYSGKEYFGEEIVDAIIEFHKRPKKSAIREKIKLTKRETEVLELIVKGLSSPKIAKALSISNHTVETHRRNTIDKLGVANSKELISFAIQNGYVNLT